MNIDVPQERLIYTESPISLLQSYMHPYLRSIRKTANEKGIRKAIELSFLNPIYGIWVQYINSNKVEIDEVTIFLNGDSVSIFTKGSIARRTHEESECELIENHIEGDIDIVELGAGTGYLTSILDQSTTGHVIGVEADPRLIEDLKRTKEYNNLDFDIIPKAYSSSKTEVEFPLKNNFKFGSLHTDSKNKVSVKAVDLKQIRNHLSDGPFGLVVDIEGAEADLIKNEFDVIEEDIEWIIIEFHPGKIGLDTTNEIQKILSDSTLSVNKTDGHVVYYKK